MFALGFIGRQTLTLTFYLSELILGQIPSSAIKTFQFPFRTKAVPRWGIELAIDVNHLTMEPPRIRISGLSKKISTPNMFSLGFIGRQTLTLTFYLSEPKLILCQTPSSAIKTFQFPFKTKAVTYMGIKLTTFLFKAKHLTIKPPWITRRQNFKKIIIPNMLALGFIPRQTLSLTF